MHINQRFESCRVLQRFGESSIAESYLDYITVELSLIRVQIDQNSGKRNVLMNAQYKTRE
jgi:hypothetical protein